MLAGTPVDVSVNSGFARLVGSAPQTAFEALVESGGGIVRGAHILRFWNSASDTALVLQRSLSPEAASDRELHERFTRWHDESVDLPGTYYLQVVHWIYRENRIANGTFVALGRTVRPDDVKVPVFLLAGAEAIPLGRHEIDTVVSSWSLCSIAQIETALQEIRRVLRPDGQFIFIEHGRAPEAGVSRWQDRLEPLTAPLLGCRLNRPMDDLIRNAGFRLLDLEKNYMDGPKLISYHYIGRAVPA